MAKEVYIKTYQKSKSYTNSLQFDGVNDYISMGDIAKLTITSNLTIEAWVYYTGKANINCIVSKRNSGASQPGYSLYINTFGTTDGKVIFETASATTTSTSTSLTVNRWTHIALVITSVVPTIYFDGVLQPLATNSVTLSSSTVSFRIGAFATNNFFYQGGLQEVRVWNLARTATQIRDNIFNSLTGTESGLVGYYKLSEATGTTANDSSASPANGTLTSFPANPWSTSLIAPLYSRSYKGFSQDYTFDSISSQVNSGYGSLNFTLPRQFDVLEAQDPQNLENYELDVVAYDDESILGTTLFSGDIVISERKLSGSAESVVYTAVSPLERLEKIDLTDSDSIVSYSSVEIGAIFRDIIDKCNTKAQQQLLKYTTTSIQNTGKNITITFKNAFVGDCLKSIFKATADNWIWYIDVDRTVYLKPISSTPDHYFYNTKDISAVERTTDKSKVVNVLKLWDGNTSPTVLREYRNQSSIDTYGYRAEAVQDGRYTTTAGALEFGTRSISTTKAPNDQLEFTIIDSSGGGYDIDKIRVGDTFKALNFDTQTNLPSLMVVTSKTDYLDYAVITASDRIDFVSRELVNLKKEQFQVNNSDHPATTYTVVSV